MRNKISHLVVPGPTKESETYRLRNAMSAQIPHWVVHEPTKESLTCHLLITMRKCKISHLVVPGPTKASETYHLRNATSAQILHWVVPGPTKESLTWHLLITMGKCKISRYRWFPGPQQNLPCGRKLGYKRNNLLKQLLLENAVLATADWQNKIQIFFFKLMELSD